MPIKVTWDNAEQTIIRFEIWDRWTWEEFEHGISTARRMLDTTSHQNPFGYLVILEKVVAFPYNIMGISRKYLLGRNPRMMSVAVVSSNPFARAVYKAVAKLTPAFSNIVELVATEEQARALLHKRLAAVTERLDKS